MIANAKADALLSKVTEPSILITSDQVIVCNGVIREKPESIGTITWYIYHLQIQNNAKNSCEATLNTPQKLILVL